MFRGHLCFRRDPFPWKVGIILLRWVGAVADIFEAESSPRHQLGFLKLPLSFPRRLDPHRILRSPFQTRSTNPRKLYNIIRPSPSSPPVYITCSSSLCVYSLFPTEEGHGYREASWRARSERHRPHRCQAHEIVPFFLLVCNPNLQYNPCLDLLELLMLILLAALCV